MHLTKFFVRCYSASKIDIYEKYDDIIYTNLGMHSVSLDKTKFFTGM